MSTASTFSEIPVKFPQPKMKILKKLVMAGIFEFGPVLLFIFVFEHFHIYKATIILIIATIVSTVATFIAQKRLPYLALYVALLTAIFGYATLSLHQPKFIQMRDTLYDVTCAMTLVIGLMINFSFLKFAFQKLAPMTNRAWERLTYAWIAYFIVTAVANEYIRRTMSLSTWFDYKSFLIVATIIFGAVSSYLIYEKAENEE